jgi:chromate reductase
LYNQDVQDVGFPGPVLTFVDQVKAADVLVFSTPEYNYSVPGVLKNALDWLSRVPDNGVPGKRAAIMGATPGKIGTARAQYHLRQIGVFLDLRFINRPEIMIGECVGKFDESGKLTDPATRELMLKMLAALKSG